MTPQPASAIDASRQRSQQRRLELREAQRELWRDERRCQREQREIRRAQLQGSHDDLRWALEELSSLQLIMNRGGAVDEAPRALAQTWLNHAGRSQTSHGRTISAPSKIDAQLVWLRALRHQGSPAKNDHPALALSVSSATQWVLTVQDLQVLSRLPGAGQGLANRLAQTLLQTSGLISVSGAPGGWHEGVGASWRAMGDALLAGTSLRLCAELRRRGFWRYPAHWRPTRPRDDQDPRRVANHKAMTALWLAEEHSRGAVWTWSGPPEFPRDRLSRQWASCALWPYPTQQRQLGQRLGELRWALDLELDQNGRIKGLRTKAENQASCLNINRTPEDAAQLGTGQEFNLTDLARQVSAQGSLETAIPEQDMELLVQEAAREALTMLAGGHGTNNNRDARHARSRGQQERALCEQVTRQQHVSSRVRQNIARCGASPSSLSLPARLLLWSCQVEDWLIATVTAPVKSASVQSSSAPNQEPTIEWAQRTLSPVPHDLDHGAAAELLLSWSGTPNDAGRTQLQVLIESQSRRPRSEAWQLWELAHLPAAAEIARNLAQRRRDDGAQG